MSATPEAPTPPVQVPPRSADPVVRAGFDLRNLRAWPVAFLGLGMAVMFAPTLGSGFARMQHDPGDTRLICFVIEHVLQALLHPRTVSFWSPPVFFPEQGTLAYSDVLLGLLPFYAPFRGLGLEPLSAFQGMQLSAALVNGIACYLLLRRHLGASRLACSVGALLFAFGAPALAMAKHPQFFPRLYLLGFVDGTLALLSGKAVTRRARVLATVELSVGLALQLWTALYLAFFAGLGLLLILPWALLAPGLRAALVARARALWPYALGAAAGFLALAGPLAITYARASAAVGGRPWWQVEPNLPRPISWLYLGPDNLWYRGLVGTRAVQALPLPWEHALGVGLVTGVTVLAGFWLGRRRPLLLLLGLGLLGLVALTTEWSPGLAPWHLVWATVPLASGVRGLTRVVLVALLPAAFALAFAIDRLRSDAAAVLLALVCAAEQVDAMPAFSKAEDRVRIERIASSIPPGCQAFFYAPLRPRGFAQACQTDAMWASWRSGVPTVNGYSSADPLGWGLEECAVESASEREGLQRALASWTARRGLAPGSVCWVELADLQ